MVVTAKWLAGTDPAIDLHTGVVVRALTASEEPQHDRSWCCRARTQELLNTVHHTVAVFIVSHMSVVVMRVRPATPASPLLYIADRLLGSGSVLLCNDPRVAPLFFFFSSRRRHTRSDRDWSSDVCSSDLHADQDDLGVVGHVLLEPRVLGPAAEDPPELRVRLLDDRVGARHRLVVLTSDFDEDRKSVV